MSGAVASLADTAANCVGDVQDCKRTISRSRKARAHVVQDEKLSLAIGQKPQSTGSAIAQLSRELAVEGVTGTSTRSPFGRVMLTHVPQHLSISSTKSPMASTTSHPPRYTIELSVYETLQSRASNQAYK